MNRPSCIRKGIVFLVLLTYLLSTSACGFVNNLLDNIITTEETQSATEDSIENSIKEDTTTKSSFFIDILPGETPEHESDGGDSKELILDEAFDRTAKECLAYGIRTYQKEIDLTSCLDAYEVYEDQIDSLVERIVNIYENIYLQDPMMFYFNGAMKIGYELQSGWSQRRVVKLTVSLQRQPVYESATPNELQAISLRVLEEADKIAYLAGNDRSDWEKMLVVHDELVRRIIYDTSLDQEKNHVASALLDGLTLCKGYAQAFQLVCQRIGLESRIVSGRSEDIEHAWNLVLLDGSYYHVDVTHDDPVPDRGAHAPVDHRHFLRSDEIMQETHQWDTTRYPVSGTDGAHYYRQNDLVVQDREGLKQKIQQFLRVSNFADSRDDHLELLYTGADLPAAEELDRIFKQVVENSSTQFSFSYHLSSGKNILQIIVLAQD